MNTSAISGTSQPLETNPEIKKGLLIPVKR